MVNNRLEYASQLLDKCSTEFEKIDTWRLERGMYYVVRFELAKRLILTASEENRAMTCEKPLVYLRKALRLFHGYYAHLEKNVYKEGALYANEVGMVSLRNQCAKMFYQKAQLVPGHLNWFLL